MLDLSTRAPVTIARVEQPRYTATAQALHWLTAALVLAVLPLAWIATSLPASPAKGVYFQLHKSVGITIFAIVAIRILCGPGTRPRRRSTCPAASRSSAGSTTGCSISSSC